MTEEITQQQREEITDLINCMRKVAAKVGSMHSWWDIIFDMEAFLEGRRTVLSFTAKGWIEYAQRVIDKAA